MVIPLPPPLPPTLSSQKVSIMEPHTAIMICPPRFPFISSIFGALGMSQGCWTAPMMTTVVVVTMAMMLELPAFQATQMIIPLSFPVCRRCFVIVSCMALMPCAPLQIALPVSSAVRMGSAFWTRRSVIMSMTVLTWVMKLRLRA